MLYARCLSKGANRIGSDLLLGLYCTEELFDTNDVLTSIKWIPQHDYNQLHWLESAIREDGYTISTIEQIYEISKDGVLIIVRDEGTAKQSMYSALYDLAMFKYSQDEN